MSAGQGGRDPHQTDAQIASFTRTRFAVQRGDLFFYPAARGDLMDAAITLGEHLDAAQPLTVAADDQIVHVAIVLENGQAPDQVRVLEAEGQGVRQGLHPGGILVPMAWRYAVWAVERALARVALFTRHGYGWADIAAVVCQVLRVPFEVLTPERVDCSHLALAYLTLAGEVPAAHADIALAATWAMAPDTVDPAALYEYCVAVQRERPPTPGSPLPPATSGLADSAGS